MFNIEGNVENAAKRTERIRVRRNEDAGSNIAGYKKIRLHNIMESL